MDAPVPASTVPASTVLSRGRRLPFIDTLGRVFSAPNKLIFLNTRFESHDLDPQVERAMTEFIAEHELRGLRVRVNEYAPLEDLGRLFTSGRTNILLRLFFGLPTWLATTMSCGRLFGGDHYNPWTDTVNLYSSHTGIALHELGHVLDFRRRTFPGLYALTRYIPGVALYQEYLASKYAIDFMRAHGMHDDELRALRILYPAYSTYVFGALVELFPSAGIRSLLFPVIAIGHVLGISHAMKREVALERQLVGEKPRVAEQWRQEWGEAASELSPGTQRGRDLWGVFLGMSVGSALCGAGALPGAFAGFALARRAGDDPRRQLPGA